MLAPACARNGVTHISASPSTVARTRLALGRGWGAAETDHTSEIATHCANQTNVQTARHRKNTAQLPCAPPHPGTNGARQSIYPGMRYTACLAPINKLTIGCPFSQETSPRFNVWSDYSVHETRHLCILIEQHGQILICRLLDEVKQ